MYDVAVGKCHPKTERTIDVMPVLTPAADECRDVIGAWQINNWTSTPSLKKSTFELGTM